MSRVVYIYQFGRILYGIQNDSIDHTKSTKKTEIQKFVFRLRNIQKTVIIRRFSVVGGFLTLFKVIVSTPVLCGIIGQSKLKDDSPVHASSLACHP